MMDELERCILYSDDCPDGQIFEGEQIAAAKENGWKDVPPAYAGDPPVEEAAQVAKDEMDTLNDLLTETNVSLQEVRGELEATKEQLGNANELIATLETELKAQPEAEEDSPE